MQRVTASFLFLYLAIPIMLPAQRAVDPFNRYHRLICLVHLKGTGQKDDPIMPEYIAEGVATASAAAAASGQGAKAETHAVNASPDPPTDTVPIASSPKAGDPQQPMAPSTAAARPGIVSWSMEFTDDKNMAIIHVVAVDRHAFDAILADKRTDIRVFEIGKDSKDTIEKEMRKYKKDFSLDSFQVVAQ
ncbi:MAG TPA: hypothetical protein VN519_11625 [Bryobacteraceae bacterium]|nr:hypothetical protein [Bryobacteraceae bacterium]